MSKILIYGAGAIGTFLGTRLNSHNEVYLYGKRKLANTSGSIEINGEPSPRPNVLSEIQKGESFDVIFVTTKLYDAKNVIHELKERNLKYGAIVFIQNGLVEKEFYDELKEMGHVVTLSIFEGYSLDTNKLTANENKMGWQIDPSEDGEVIAALLQESEIKNQINPEISRIRAEKMLMVSAAAGLSVIENKKLGELLEDDQCREKMTAVLREGFDVLSTEYDLGEFEEYEKKFIDTLENLKDHYPSMYQDVASKRETEIEFLNGLILKMGTYHRIPTPLNQEIYFKVKRLTDYKEHENIQEITRSFKLR